MSIDAEQLKKIKVRYLKCQKGDLHQGEVLNFICIDPQCQRKGLICPVCQSTQHESHQTLHLKVFLTEINSTLHQKSQFCGLASYLQSLDSTKRQMLRSLKQTVEQLSLKIKDVEEKIQQGYCTLRRTILSQSTVSLRLPELYRLLTEEGVVQDDQEILKEISRYSELLEFKNNKLIAVDSAKELVVEYISKSGLLSAHLTTVITEASKIFNNLPLSINKFSSQNKEPIQTKNQVFSKQFKSASIQIENEKKVKLNQTSLSGIAFVDKSTQVDGVYKAAFKVVSGGQGEYISIGVANPLQYKQTNFQVNLEAEPNLFGLCSYGILNEQLQGQAFIYSQGDTVDVTWQPSESKLTFSRRHSIEKCVTILPEDVFGQEFSFFVALSSAETRIELVE